MQQHTELPSGVAIFTATEDLTLVPGARYAIFKHGTIGSASEYSLRAKSSSGEYVTYDEDQNGVNEFYEIISPPSGIIQAYLPSAAGTTVYLDFNRIPNP